ncbi:MAG: hypothetical protein Q8Q09_21055 [Deltaproteobacteria bacterium]|nr:hypothetical protein [Deltaproteobacteria bacterium]
MNFCTHPPAIKTSLAFLALLALAHCAAPSANADVVTDTSRDGMSAQDAGTLVDVIHASDVSPSLDSQADAHLADVSTSADSRASDGAMTDAGEQISCDHRRVSCESLPPVCEAGFVPSVRGLCWGPCVSIDSCVCTEAAECPDPGMYTCNRARMRCTPFLGAK